MDVERNLWKTISDQAGVASLWQALEIGVTRDRIRTLIKRGALRQVRYGVIAASGAPETFRFRCFLGLLLAGPRKSDSGIRAALCRRTAAVRFDMIEPLPETEPVHILTTRRVQDRGGFRFHFTSRLPEDELRVVEGLTFTDPIRTYLDMCDAEPFRALRIYRRGLRKGCFSETEVIERLERESRQGRAGLRAARDAVLSTRPDAAQALSAREDHYFDLLVQAGYPPPSRNVMVRGTLGFDWQIDLFYEERNFGFEISPVEHHSDPEVVKKDQRKITDLKSVGIDIAPIDDDLPDTDFLRLTRALLGPPEDFRVGKAVI